jgi:hypothetical protein
MVNFSSLHDEERPADVFYHHRRDKLLIPRLTVVISLILAFHNTGTFFSVAVGGNILEGTQPFPENQKSTSPKAEG